VKASRGDSEPAAVPPASSWRARLDDPDEPLYTMAVAVDLLGIDHQTMRRLQDAIGQSSARPSGNQRRYSRRDIESLAAAVELTRDGIPPASLARVLDLEQQVRDLRATQADDWT